MASLGFAPGIANPPAASFSAVVAAFSIKATRASLSSYSSSPGQNHVPSNPLIDAANQHSSEPLPPFLKTAFVLGAAAAFSSLFGGGNYSSGGGGGGGEGGGGGGGAEGGNFWSRLFGRPAIAKDENSSQEWDSHGLPANITVQLNKLSGFKKYKVSDIRFFDRSRRSTQGTEDPFFEVVSLRPGGVYTKFQLQKELETCATSGMFEKVDLEVKSKRDGTIGITISFLESTWQSASSFRCINVGLMAELKDIEMDPDMTEKERREYYLSQKRDYRKRIDRARSCLLPTSVEDEILHMLRIQGKVSARLLLKIRDKVQQWYHENGYGCARVVNFGNLNTKEVVCEVVEGDITQMVIQFQDELGDVYEGNTYRAVLERELPPQLQKGRVFNIEASRQALMNINSLGLFSYIEVNPRVDEKNEGGIIVEITLKEF